jgi:hypothetical protein
VTLRYHCDTYSLAPASRYRFHSSCLLEKGRMTAPERADAPAAIFVEPSGRRVRRARLAGAVVALLCATYGVLVAVSLTTAHLGPLPGLADGSQSQPPPAQAVPKPAPLSDAPETKSPVVSGADRPGPHSSLHPMHLMGASAAPNSALRPSRVTGDAPTVLGVWGAPADSAATHAAAPARPPAASAEGGEPTSSGATPSTPPPTQSPAGQPVAGGRGGAVPVTAQGAPGLSDREPAGAGSRRAVAHYQQAPSQPVAGYGS